MFKSRERERERAFFVFITDFELNFAKKSFHDNQTPRIAVERMMETLHRRGECLAEFRVAIPNYFAILAVICSS